MRGDRQLGRRDAGNIPVVLRVEKVVHVHDTVVKHAESLVVVMPFHAENLFIAVRCIKVGNRAQYAVKIRRHICIVKIAGDAGEGFKPLDVEQLQGRGGGAVVVEVKDSHGDRWRIAAGKLLDCVGNVAEIKL